jgi:hypothetical protein
MITETLPLIVVTSAAIVTSTILLATAKRNVPMTRREVNLLFTLHKQTVHSCGHKMQPLMMKSGKIAGFQCECGFRHIQKRPYFSRSPKTSIEAIPGHKLAAYAGHMPTSAKT